MSPATVAKIASQTGFLYDSVSAAMAIPDLKKKLPPNWVNQCQGLASYFNAVANYKQSLAVLAQDQYGQQVGYLQRASSFINYVCQMKPPLTAMIDAISVMQVTINNEYRQAEADNSTIYHMQVPKQPAAIGRAMIAKVAPFPSNSETGEEELFKDLIPVAVHQAASLYTEKKAELVRTQLRSIEEANEIAKGSLCSMNLPGSLVELEKPSSISPELALKLQSLQSKGGANSIIECMTSIQQMNKESERILSRAIEVLDQEEKEDNELRAQHKGWDRTPSHSLTAKLRQDASNIKLNIDHATKSDEIIQSKWQEQQSLISTLSGNVDEVKKVLPPPPSLINIDSEAVVELQQSLGKLDKLVSKRRELQEKLRVEAEKDDITQSLFSSEEDNEIIFEKELKKYEPVINQIKDSLQEQDSLMQVISDANDRFTASKEGDQNSQQREEILQRLGVAFKTFHDLHAHLREGVAFYTKMKNLLDQYLETCEKFVQARKEEQQQLLSELAMKQEQEQRAAASQINGNNNISSFGNYPAFPVIPSTTQISQTGTPMYSAPPSQQLSNISLQQTSGQTTGPQGPFYPFPNTNALQQQQQQQQQQNLFHQQTTGNPFQQSLLQHQQSPFQQPSGNPFQTPQSQSQLPQQQQQQQQQTPSNPFQQLFFRQ